MLRRATSLRQGTEEADDKFFGRITNLSLQSRGLDGLGSLIAQCGKLRVLFLYNNFLRDMCELSPLRNLTHLYLEDNDISRIELSGVRGLLKLGLSGNRISLVDGLHQCGSLEELHLSNQRLEPGQCLTFDPASLDAMADSLRLLTVSNSSVTDLTPLVALPNLHTLRAGRNLVEDSAQAQLLLQGCTLLQELELQGNPMAHEPGFRDMLILRSELLAVIDGKPVKPNQRAFLQAREEHRRKTNDQRERLMAKRATHGHKAKPAASIFSEATFAPPPPGIGAAAVGVGADAHRDKLNGVTIGGHHKRSVRKGRLSPTRSRSHASEAASEQHGLFLSVGALHLSQDRPRAASRSMLLPSIGKPGGAGGNMQTRSGSKHQ